MKPYFDNIYNMGSSNARCIGQEWFCGKCHKPMYQGITDIESCPNCNESIDEKDIALQQAKNRFGEGVKK